MKYILIILLFSCSKAPDWTLFSISEKEKSSYLVLNRPEYPDDYHEIEYIGNWTHMSIEKQGKTGSFANTNQDTARFKFWGYGVRIRTEEMERHTGYKVFIDHVFMGSVNVKNPINTTNNQTFLYMDLKPLKPDDHNHVLELVPNGGYFVLNSLTIHYYVDPTPDEDCIPYVDTTYFDSIRWETKINWIDSTIYHFKDSTTYHHVYDTTGSRVDSFFIMPKKITFELK